MSESWPTLALALAVCLTLLAVVVWLVLGGTTYRAGDTGGSRRPHRHSFRRRAKSGEPEAPRRKRAAIIINPTKFTDVAGVTAELTAASATLGWETPLVLETTADDPGTGQTRIALDDGVDLVCPLGGDGTIRAVAVALAGTRTPMGLLPRGTGNLLARNLDVPFDDVVDALRVACDGRNRPIDVAWITLDPEAEEEAEDAGQAEEPVTGPPVRRHPFLVMAGMGFDAAIMAGTSEPLKDRLGWFAYFVTGFKNLFIRRFGIEWTVDGKAQPHRDVRTIVFGNCGTLTGGICLMPEAELDDGTLDVVVVAPRTLIGWAGLAGRVLRRSPREMTQLSRAQGTTFTVDLDSAQLVQVDGDVIGEASRVRVEVDPQALIVRVASR